MSIHIPIKFERQLAFDYRSTKFAQPVCGSDHKSHILTQSKSKTQITRSVHGKLNRFTVNNRNTFHFLYYKTITIVTEARWLRWHRFRLTIERSWVHL